MPTIKPMTPEQMRERSSSKIKQIMEMMKVLDVRVEARQRVDPGTGFIDLMVFWIDDEKYAQASPPVESAGPSGETSEAHA